MLRDIKKRVGDEWDDRGKMEGIVKYGRKTSSPRLSIRLNPGSRWIRKCSRKLGRADAWNRLVGLMGK